MSGKIVVRTMNVGLCNQLFTYAFARYLEKKYHKEIWLDYSHTNLVDMKHHAMYEDSFAKFNLNITGVIENFKDYNDKAGTLGTKLDLLINPWFVRKRNRNSYLIKKEKNSFTKYAEKGLFLNFIADSENSYFEEVKSENCLLYGYWQLPFFARQIEQELREEIVKPLLLELEEDEFLKNIKNTNSICVHIRRGDYVGDKMHDVCTNKYYRAAIQQMKSKFENPIFYIFSDSIENVKVNYDIFDEKDNVVYVDKGYADYNELVLMSSCKAFVISNSSFSWWAQFLSGSNIVIAPSKWYGAEDKKTLLYEKHWEIVEV